MDTLVVVLVLTLVTSSIGFKGQRIHWGGRGVTLGVHFLEERQ